MIMSLTQMIEEIVGYTPISSNLSGVLLSLNGRLVKSMHKDFFDRLYIDRGLFSRFWKSNSIKYSNNTVTM